MLTTILCFEHYHPHHTQWRIGAQRIQAICLRSHSEWQTDSETKPKSLIGNYVPFFLITPRKWTMTRSRTFQLLVSSDRRIQCLLIGSDLHRTAVKSRIQDGHWGSSWPFIQIINEVRVLSFKALLDHLVSFLTWLTTDEASFLEPFLYFLLKTIFKIYLSFYPLELRYLGH